MGARGTRERLSETKRQSNRRNAQAPRPGARVFRGEVAERIMAAVHEARAHTPEAMRLLVETMNDEAIDLPTRLACAREVLDRGSVPRRSDAGLVGFDAVKPVLIDFSRTFDPPPGWNGDADVEGPPAH